MNYNKISIAVTHVAIMAAAYVIPPCWPTIFHFSHADQIVASRSREIFHDSKNETTQTVHSHSRAHALTHRQPKVN